MVVIVTILRCLAIFFLSGSLFPLLGNDTVFDADPSLLGGCPGSVPLQQEAAAEEPAVATTAVPECLEGSSVDGRNFSETCSMDGTWYLVCYHGNCSDGTRYTLLTVHMYPWYITYVIVQSRYSEVLQVYIQVPGEY